MRLWSLHPRYLDTVGLVACWRESLLAQKVLSGTTRGYRNHPQLDRFRSEPLAIGAYLRALADEADARGHRFDRSRIAVASEPRLTITVNRGQLEYERERLAAKFVLRSPELVNGLLAEKALVPHPLFEVVDGGIEPWERVTAATSTSNPTPILTTEGTS